MAAEGITGDLHTNGALEIGASVTGRLVSAGQRAWYKVRLAAGQSYHFSLAGGATGQGDLRDPLLYLYHPAGQLVRQNDDSGGQINSRLTFLAPTSGEYFLGAGAFQDAQAGAFQLSAGSYRDDLTSLAYGRLEVGGRLAGNLEVLADLDWIRVELSAGTRYRISVQGQDTGQGTLKDPYLFVYDGNGDSLAQADDGGVRRDAQLDFTPASGGGYFLAVGAFQDAGSGTYQVGVEAMREDASTAPEAPQSLTPGSQVSGEISSPGQQRRHALDLVAGRTYCFDLTGSSSGRETLADPYLYLYDPSGALVNWDDDGGRGRDSRLVFTAWASGTYHLGAAALAGDQRGTYQLGAFQVPYGPLEQPGGQPAPTAFGARQGSLDAPGQHDWAALALEAATTYLITLESAAGDAGLPDPELRLLNSSGFQLATARGQGLDRPASLAFTPQDGGVYYVDAGAQGQDDAGRYLLSIVGRQVEQFNAQPTWGESLPNPFLPQDQAAANFPPPANPANQLSPAPLADPGSPAIAGPAAPAGAASAAQLAVAPAGTC